MQSLTGRREALETLGTLVMLPCGLFLVSCGGGGDSSTNAGAAPQKSGTQIVYTSTSVQSHVHTFKLEMADIATPPSDGVAGDTSTDGGHSHSVSITMEQLQSVGSGQSVKVTTSSVSGHTHTFTFTNVS